MTDCAPRRRRSPSPTLWLRGCYFWYFAGIGCFGPYITLYYRQLQLTGPQIGLLAAILPLGVAFLAPLWGGLADTFSAHRLMLRAALLVAALAALLIARATTFGLLVPLALLLAACLAAIPALLDSYALTLSQREGLAFGQLRIWGSLGFIASVWLIARMMGASVSPLFLLAYAATLALACLATAGLPPLQGRTAAPLWHGVAGVLRNRSVLALLLSMYLVFSNATVLGSFLGIYLTELGGGVGLVGVASVIGALSELPVMAFGSRLLDRFSSRGVLLLAVGMYVLRLLCYSLPPDVSWVALIQLLHGVSFGLSLLASVTLIHELAGQERAATAQGVLGATTQGFAAVTGALLGGLLLDRVGAVNLFRVAAVGMGAALIVCLLAMRVVARGYLGPPGGADTAHAAPPASPD